MPLARLELPALDVFALGGQRVDRRVARNGDHPRRSVLHARAVVLAVAITLVPVDGHKVVAVIV